MRSLERSHIFQRRALSGQRLKRNHRKRVDVGWTVGSGILRARRQLRSHTRQCRRDSKACDTRSVGRHDDVARVEHAVLNAASGGMVDRGGQRLDQSNRVLDRIPAAVAQNDIERLTKDVFLRQVHGTGIDPCRDWRRDMWVIDVGADKRFEMLYESSRLLGCQFEAKYFDRDQAIVPAFVRAKHRAERARTNLMENLERPECLWRKVQNGIFAAQRANGNINSLHFPVDIRRIPGIRKLAADYAFQFSSLAPFFSGDPTSASSWDIAIANAQRHPRSRAELSDLVTRQLQRREAPAPALEAAARLQNQQTVAILTGQQAGLFGGPLYTLYKGLTAIKLAARVSQQHGVPAVAAFWVESEDHDWEEVASCSVLDSDYHRRTITLAPPQGAGQTPIGLLHLGDEITRTVDELAATLPKTEFTSSLLDDLRKVYRPRVPAGEAFARWLDRLLGDFGLIVFDCSDAAAKPLASDVFAHEISHPGRTWELAGEAGERLTANGYHAQVEVSSHGGAALFRLNGGRRPLESGDPRALEKDARARPETFSPNVLLRPIVEDSLFPTICYVSGPNELAYLAQLRRVYEHFGVPMPLFFPRASATILDAASARFLAKHDLPFETLQARDESALNRLLAASLPESVDRTLKDAEDTIAEKMAALIESVPAVDPTLEGAARSTLGKLQHDLSSLRGKVISAAKKRDETLRRQFFRAQAQAFPDGIPQERALGSIGFLNRYGPALVQRLVHDLPLDLGQHWVLTL